MRATITQLAAYVGVSERTIHRYLAGGKWPHKRLPGGLIEIDDSLLIRPEEGQEGLLLATLKRIEQKLDALSAAVISLSAGQPQVTHHVRMTANLPAQGELPEGLTAWRHDCKEMGYIETTVKRAIHRGAIPIHRGRWKRGKVFIEGAVDEAGMRAIDALYGGEHLCLQPPRRLSSRGKK